MLPLLLPQPPEQLQGCAGMCCSCPGSWEAEAVKAGGVTVQQNLLQGFSAVPQCLQDFHPLCHKLVTEPPGLCGLICCFGPFSSSLSTVTQGCQQHWEAPWDNQMISARAEAAPVKGKFCPAHAPEGCESRAGTSRVGQFIEKSTSLLSWLQGFLLLGSGNAQGRRRAEHRGLPEDLRCHGGT